MLLCCSQHAIVTFVKVVALKLRKLLRQYHNAVTSAAVVVIVIASRLSNQYPSLDINCPYNNKRAVYRYTLGSCSWQIKLIGLISGISPFLICTAFLPQNTEELRGAVRACVQLSPKEDCKNNLHGLITEWNVSRVTNIDNF